MNDNTAYTTVNDYRDEVVIPALADNADEFNTDKIAHTMTEWVEGRLVERADVDFWTVVAENEK